MGQAGQGKGSYAAAGVDINAGNRAVELIKGHVRGTFRPEVLGDIGGFGGLFQLAKYEQPVLVASTDSVGTKVKIACVLNRHDSIGTDLVNHCVNDIFVCGAEPLFFLDYVGLGKLVPEQVERIVKGVAKACRAVNCALIGGEMAELPALYAEGDYDLVGFVVGVAGRDSIIDGRSIRVGDTILGLPSSGLHTNGYSLVRKVFHIEGDDRSWDVFYPELGRNLGDELLEPHRCYYPLLKTVLPLIKGMAHITGGGLVGNVPRILPAGLAARFQAGTWPILPIFPLIQRRGSVETDEMYRVFNMGLGMVVICSPADAARLSAAVPEAIPVGEVVEQEGRERARIDGAA